MATSQLLAEHGQSPWIDYLQGAIAAGDAYDEQLGGLLEHQRDDIDAKRRQPVAA
jgi:hypothetical protein